MFAANIPQGKNFLQKLLHYVSQMNVVASVEINRNADGYVVPVEIAAKLPAWGVFKVLPVIDKPSKVRLRRGQKLRTPF